MYEHRSDPLLPRRQFVTRVTRHVLLALAASLSWLAVGVAFYQYCAHQYLADAILNASMILSGMGPIYQFKDPEATDAAKYFASFYALVSGFVFLAASGLVIAPVLHRILHTLHLDQKGDSGGKQDS